MYPRFRDALLTSSRKSKVLESRIKMELSRFIGIKWRQLGGDSWVLSVVPTTSTHTLTYLYGSHQQVSQQVSQQVTITYTVTASRF